MTLTDNRVGPPGPYGPPRRSRRTSLGRRRRLPALALVLVLGFVLAVAAVLIPPGTDRNPGTITVPETAVDSTPLSAAQRTIADQIVSVFENSSLTLRYDYAEKLDDGRGFTLGRAGFTTGTGDALVVVRDYTAEVKNNPLAKYLPRLEKLAAADSASVEGLDGLPEAWAKAARDKRFRAVQDEVLNAQSFRPAVAIAQEVGVTSTLGITILYDTMIQHGLGTADGTRAMVDEATEQAGGTPADGVSQETWLRAFLDVRRDHLENPVNERTQAEWSKSVGRVDALRELMDEDHWDLAPPITVNPWNNPQPFVLRG